MLNSLTYGWWTNRNLYIADPDHVVLGTVADQGARNLAEARSRFLSAVVAGGMILDSSAYSDDPQAREWAPQVYTNAALNRIAQNNEAFRPVEGDTGDKAENEFVLKSGNSYLLAVFNFDSVADETLSIPLDRISPALTTGKSVEVHDLSENGPIPPSNPTDTRNELVVHLASSASELLEITPRNLRASQ
jgi:hypothetical protein